MGVGWGEEGRVVVEGGGGWGGSVGGGVVHVAAESPGLPL